jgi:hypothetical protein
VCVSVCVYLLCEHEVDGGLGVHVQRDLEPLHVQQLLVLHLRRQVLRRGHLPGRTASIHSHQLARRHPQSNLDY